MCKTITIREKEHYGEMPSLKTIWYTKQSTLSGTTYIMVNPKNVVNFR